MLNIFFTLCIHISTTLHKQHDDVQVTSPPHCKHKHCATRVTCKDGFNIRRLVNMCLTLYIHISIMLNENGNNVPLSSLCCKHKCCLTRGTCKGGLNFLRIMLNICRTEFCIHISTTFNEQLDKVQIALLCCKNKCLTGGTCNSGVNF